MRPAISLCALFLVAGCATTMEAPRPACRTPRLLVCDGSSRPAIARELARVAPQLDYAWDWRCEPTRLAAGAAVDCVPGAPCQLPEFVDGQPLADPDGRYEVVLMIAGTDTVPIRKEKRVLFIPNKKGSRVYKGTYDLVDTDEPTPGLNGPVYLFDPRGGTMLATRRLEQADSDTLQALLAGYLDDLCRGRLALAR